MENAQELGQLIWDYHTIRQPLTKTDCIFVLGSYDIGPAKRGMELFLSGYAPYIIFSGGFGRNTQELFAKPEADTFAELALHKGIPKDKIIVENKSTNTGENIRYTKELLVGKDLNFNSFILIHKPYMARRTYAAFKKLWPGKDFIITSAEVTFEEYCKTFPIAEVINIMVGDLQRIILYPEKGYQILQDVPDKVMDAYKKLVALGYDKELVN